MNRAASLPEKYIIYPPRSGKRWSERPKVRSTKLSREPVISFSANSCRTATGGPNLSPIRPLRPNTSCCSTFWAWSIKFVNARWPGIFSQKQTDDGSWTIWFGGPGDLSTTIESYFALKLAGYSADHPAMCKAREFILANGGILKARVFTKVFLALFGEFSWMGVPSMPIELMLLPNWAYFNMYEFSSWSRATIIPLSVVMSERPVRKLPPLGQSSGAVCPSAPADRLYLHQGRWHPDLEKLFHRCRSSAQGLRIQLRSGRSRKRATATAEQWILEHQEPTGDWGGIQPAMLNAILALHCLGYANDHPAVVKGLEALANFCIEDDESLVLQSCVSPVWDTALALVAMQEAGVPHGSSGFGQSGPVAAGSGGSPQGGLAGQVTGTGTGRMGFRVPERLVSGC